VILDVIYSNFSLDKASKIKTRMLREFRKFVFLTNISIFSNEPEAYSYNTGKTDFSEVKFTVLSIFGDIFEVASESPQKVNSYLSFCHILYDYESF
jgi:hypothetical protein